MGRLEWGQALIPGLYILLIAIALYFVHYGTQSERGLAALHDAERTVGELEAELARLDEQHAEISNRVRRLDESFLDLDLLEERARAVLGYVRQDEIVIR